MSVKAFFSMEFWSVFAIAFTAINVTNGNKASGVYRRLYIDEDPDFMNIDAIQATVTLRKLNWNTYLFLSYDFSSVAGGDALASY